MATPPIATRSARNGDRPPTAARPAQNGRSGWEKIFQLRKRISTRNVSRRTKPMNDVTLRRSPARLLDSADGRRMRAGTAEAAAAPLSARLLARATAKWGKVETVEVDNLELISPEVRCAVTGLLWKPQRLKLSELRKSFKWYELPSERNDAASPHESLFLEGERIRVRLTGDCPDSREVVTGLPCALLGFPTDSGTFRVTDHCFLNNHCLTRDDEDRDGSRTAEGKILFVSGLNFSANAESLGVTLLAEWITGMAGNSEAQRTQASVVCTVLAGNSVRDSLVSRTRRDGFGEEAQDGIVFRESARAARKLDDFLRSILTTCSVLLMPGEFDPVSHFLPQQPFSTCILPRSNRYRSFHAGTNPWSGRINGRLIAGSSGQPVADILRIEGLLDRSPIHWLEKTLEWGSYAPVRTRTSSPTNDPFLIGECPEVYFAGNMARFETKLWKEELGQETRLICIPSFAETQTAVLLDLADLSCQTISFG